MTKNPFEIRLELLKMAQDIVEKDYQEKREAYWNIVYTMSAEWNKDVSELIQESKKLMPEMYTPQDIMEKAKDLYSFVSEKGDSK